MFEKREKGIGPRSGGQSGDTLSLPEEAEADSESVTELVEEEQYEEVSAVRTRPVLEDDVPLEYTNQD